VTFCCDACAHLEPCSRLDALESRAGIQLTAQGEDRPNPFLARIATPIVLSTYVQGAGAEQQQLATSRSRVMPQLAGGAVGQSLHGQGAGRRLATVDVKSPQQFTQHVAIVQQMTPGIAGIAPHLPGRAPAAGWDGEPGAGAPFREAY
jgi:hypothetical protein